MRREQSLGVNRFLRLVGTSKRAYYRRKRRWQEVQGGALQGARRARGSRCFRRCPKREVLREQTREIALAFPAYGYRKAWAELLRRGMVATKSTVYRVLREEGLLLSTRRRRPYPGQHQSKDQRPGSEPPRPDRVGLVLSADGTLWRLMESKGASSLGGYRILNVIEEKSRYLLASVAGRVGEGETARLAKEALERTREEARRLGLSTKGLLLRTDRGLAFQSEVFRGYLQNCRIGQVFAPVGKPEGMGKIERLHRSLKEEKLMREEIRDPLELQRALGGYRHFYNTRRLHQALGYRTPLEVVESRGVKAASFW